MGRLRSFSRGDIPVADVKGQVWNFDDHDNTTGNNWQNYTVTTQTGTTQAERDHNGVNKLLVESVGGANQTFTYDANGNLLSDGHRGFKWDFKNRLREVHNLNVTPAVTFAVYEYDAENRRVKATNPFNGEVRTFTNDGMNEIEEDSSLIGAFPVAFVHGVGIDELIGRSQLDSTGAVTDYVYYVQDEQQSVYALTDLNGFIVEGYEYDPYGAATVFRPGTSGSVTFTADDDIGTADDSKAEYLYTGRRYDPDAELYYFRSRYYDTDAGRFLSVDTVGTWGDRRALGNAYTFGANRPQAGMDPMGTNWVEFLELALGFVQKTVEGATGEFKARTVHYESAVEKFVRDETLDGDLWILSNAIHHTEDCRNMHATAINYILGGAVCHELGVDVQATEWSGHYFRSRSLPAGSAVIFFLDGVGLPVAWYLADAEVIGPWDELVGPPVPAPTYAAEYVWQIQEQVFA